ncbi:hypothetical protein IMY05_C3416000400 [Salix suchowensis]|nr:hypothetical protein IMY05_C3416000400 [Salix suchowensis]
MSFVTCPHSCEHTTSASKKANNQNTTCLLWYRNSGSIANHRKNPAFHANCDCACLGHTLLSPRPNCQCPTPSTNALTAAATPSEKDWERYLPEFMPKCLKNNADKASRIHEELLNCAPSQCYPVILESAKVHGVAVQAPVEIGDVEELEQGIRGLSVQPSTFPKKIQVSLPVPVLFVQAADGNYEAFRNGNYGCGYFRVSMEPRHYELMKKECPDCVGPDVSDEAEVDQKKQRGKEKSTKGGKLTIAVEMMRLPKKWAVSFMSWEKYLQKVVDMDDELSGYRIIVGGASLDQDLLEPKMLFSKNPETLPRYLLGVEALSETVWITPSPKECLYLGDKIQLAAVLTDISMRHGWQCPKVVQVPPQTGKDEFSMIDWKETVAKRTFSCEAKHVMLPTDSTFPDRAFHQNLDTTHRRWRKKTHPAVQDLEPVWFLQPFNEDIINKGEVRMYFAGETFIFAASTSRTPAGEFDVALVRGTMVPLSHMM